MDLFSKVNDPQNRELKIELHTAARHREPPKTEMECIVLLKRPVDGRPDGIDITIEQQYTLQKVNWCKSLIMVFTIDDHGMVNN